MEALDWVKKGKCCTKSDFSCFSHKKFLKAPLTTFFEASIMSIRYFKKFFEASPIDIKCIDSGSVVWKFYVRECFFCSVTFGWLNAVFGVWARHRPPSVPIGVQERIVFLWENVFPPSKSPLSKRMLSACNTYLCNHCLLFSPIKSP